MYALVSVSRKMKENVQEFQFLKLLLLQKFDLAKAEVKKDSAKRQKYQNVQEKVSKEVGRYALIRGTKAVVDKYPKIYPKYDLKRISVNTLKTKCKSSKGYLCMEFVTADWCYREVVEPRSDCKKTYLW